jgi:LmbE family N-acetylglucosaminyl deacetylase
MEETPQRVLVVVPHPNDSEFWCAGTVAHWISKGADVRYVVCTDGGKGTTDPEISSSDLMARREREQAEAAKILGVQELVSLGRKDGTLEDTDDFRRELVRQIRQVRPDVVICPEPYRKNLAWHRDHRITGQVTLDAVFPCARDHLHFEELWRDEGLEPHKTGMVLFWGTETPNAYVSIDSSLEAKSQAVKIGESRISGRSGHEVDEFIRQQGQEGAGDSGGNYGEAFRRITFRT